MAREVGTSLNKISTDAEKKSAGAASPMAAPTPVETPAGSAHVFVDMPPKSTRGVLVLGHGAGGDVDAPDLVLLRDAALEIGFAVARVRQPYRVAGRRAPAPPRQLDAAWLCVVDQLQSASGPFASTRRLRDRPVVFAGRSSGARVACRTARAGGAVAVVALAFPLHPPGRPERSRAAELETGVPLLVFQGSRDAFGRPGEFPRGTEIIEVAGSDHGLKSAAFAAAAHEAARWMLTRSPN